MQWFDTDLQAPAAGDFGVERHAAIAGKPAPTGDAGV